jgi:hypothetical protein
MTPRYWGRAAWFDLDHPSVVFDDAAGFELVAGLKDKRLIACGVRAGDPVVVEIGPPNARTPSCFRLGQVVQP